MRVLLRTITFLVVLAVPVEIYAQCAICTDIDQPWGCKWGPYKDASANCHGPGCIVSGSCGGGVSSSYDLDGRVHARYENVRALHGFFALPTPASLIDSLASLGEVFQARDCAGRLQASYYSDDGVVGGIAELTI